MGAVIITGGTSGIGRATAITASAAGRDVVILDREAPGAEDTALSGLPFETVDVTDRESVQDAMARAAERVGDVSGIVCSAGVSAPVPADEVTLADWSRVVDVNLSGSFWTAQAALPHLDRTDGAIVMVSSIAAERAAAGRSAYAATKAGVGGLVRQLAGEWGPRGVRVNAVAPSWVRTAMMDRLAFSGDLDPERLAERVPLRRICTPAEVAAPILFLLSAEASFVTGQTLWVDGGYSVAE